jgi:putative transposase
MSVKYAWISEHQNKFSISAMCKVMGLSRSGYYEHLHRPQSAQTMKNKEMSAMVGEIFNEGRATYGARRIRRKLVQKKVIVSRRKVSKLMKESGLEVKTKRKFKATTDSNHNQPVAPNLLDRKFDVHQPNCYWVGDITYVPTEEGWLYLATVIDLYSRKVIGWSMDSRMKAELVNNALLMAIWQRKPKAGLVWHTDRGSQYASDSHRGILKQHHITQSMSRKGDCWDNAVAESFFHSLKTESIHHHKFKTREEAKHVIFEYIEVFYNRIRIHSANDYLSPVDYESLLPKILQEAV